MSYLKSTWDQTHLSKVEPNELLSNGVQKIVPEQNCPPVRVRVWFTTSLRIRAGGGGGGQFSSEAIFLDPFKQLVQHFNDKISCTFSEFVNLLNRDNIILCKCINFFLNSKAKVDFR